MPHTHVGRDWLAASAVGDGRGAMNVKQEKLNAFLHDFGEFVTKYYRSRVSGSVEICEDGWVAIRILGAHDSWLEIRSDNAEVTVIFGESHWHIDGCNAPSVLEDIYERTIESVLAILDGNLATYSCWLAGKCKGGGSSVAGEDDLQTTARELCKEFDEIRIKRWALPQQRIRAS